MSNKKGFTLIEILVVMAIIAALATMAIPTYTTMLQQGAATAAQNNLVAIYNAQKNYYFNNNAYCVSSGNPSDCGYNLTTLDSSAHLNLNVTDSSFNYTCTNASGFQCTATNKSDSQLILTLTNNPIVLPGGAGAANPSCASDNTSYCPKN